MKTAISIKKQERTFPVRFEVDGLFFINLLFVILILLSILQDKSNSFYEDSNQDYIKIATDCKNICNLFQDRPFCTTFVYYPL